MNNTIMSIPIKYYILWLTIFMVSFGSMPTYARNGVKELRCEYLVNPVGIDIANPRLSWEIVSDERNVLQEAYEIRVATSEEAVKEGRSLLWDSGKVFSAESVNIEYKGPALSPMQRVFWQVRVWTGKGRPTAWSEPSYWETGLLDAGNWKANWISSPFDKPDEKIRPCSYFRKDFQVIKQVQTARLYISALGLYEAYLNGKKVGDQLFTPGWTSYNKRVQYQTYDITAMLSGTNVIGAIVGDGWYRGFIGTNQNYYGDQTALIAQLQINYTDGTTEVIVTDGSWKATKGAILFSDIYHGEIYDARLESQGWDKIGFNDKTWVNSMIYDHSKEILIAQQSVPVKAIQEIHPLKLIQTAKGETVYDMGQNMVGYVRLKVIGKAGEKVALKFAEVLDKAGNFYTENLRTASATDMYILKGDGEEVYEPRFTYHGFRYVKIEGFPGTPGLNTITGIVIHSDMEPTGKFACSDSLVNQLQHNIQWSQKGNFFDIPTDCPQRDERLGWTGDAQVFMPTAAFNYNVAPFFTRWLGDLSVDQLPDGSVPNVIPDVTKNEGSAGWADASVIVPWNLYLAYGDRRILEKQYPSMKTWVEYMRGRAGNDYVWDGDPQFGDWQALVPSYVNTPELVTDKDMVATAYYYYSTTLLARIAIIIGRTEDAAYYSKLADKIKWAFSLAFIDSSGRLTSDTQTAYLLAIAFDLLPSNILKQATGYLASYIENVGHLTTGFIGTPLLCKTLTDLGRVDLAYKLFMRKEYPSWLYPVTQGATTIWERWDGIQPDGTFQNPGMNSFNHYAYGAVGEWLYQYVVGIRPDEKDPGYRHIILAPHPGGGLTNARGEYESMYGTIVSDWSVSGGKMIYHAVIPPNSKATVILPVQKEEAIKIDGKRVKPDATNSIEIGSGDYRIEFDYK
jgi:alpha-L-rhamnosidase